MEVVGWDTEYKVLVDQMKIMLSFEEVQTLRRRCDEHLNGHSPLEREAIGWRTVRRLGPSTEENIRRDYFDEGVENGSPS